MEYLELETNSNVRVNKENDTVVNQHGIPVALDEGLEFHWYLFQIRRQKSCKILKEMELKISDSGFSKFFNRILFIESFVDVVNNITKHISFGLNPSKDYILIKMKLTIETLYLILGILTVDYIKLDRENNIYIFMDKHVRALHKINENNVMKQGEKEKSKEDFFEGDGVLVIQGSFANFHGTVQEVDVEKRKLKVLLLILGRKAPVELDFSQVSRIA